MLQFVKFFLYEQHSVASVLVTRATIERALHSNVADFMFAQMRSWFHGIMNDYACGTAF